MYVGCINLWGRRFTSCPPQNLLSDIKKAISNDCHIYACFS
nr:MAG TPA: hypothetical protein [Caudoviricetes sp.]